MAGTTVQNSQDREIWALIRRQHGVISAAQLLDHGLTRAAVEHRIRTGRLRPLRRGIYALGPMPLPWRGWLHAAMLACGEPSAISHLSAAAVYGLRPRPALHHVTVPEQRRPRWPALAVHRRVWRPEDVRTLSDGLAITTVPRTIVDLSRGLPPAEIEALIDKADSLDRIDFDALGGQLNRMGPVRGKRRVRAVTDAAGFVATHSALERRFVPIATRAGLPPPRTQAWVNGHRVDFFWPDLRLVVETDSLRYHRTPARQKADRIRDHDHLAAGLLPLRFTYAQVWHEPGYVEQRLREAGSQ